MIKIIQTLTLTLTLALTLTLDIRALPSSPSATGSYNILYDKNLIHSAFIVDLNFGSEKTVLNIAFERSICHLVRVRVKVRMNLTLTLALTLTDL
jgi:hypothetical protein